MSQTPSRVSLTTTLPYVNADPHVGFALEIVQADALARYLRLTGREVFFNTGTDEHGQKLYEAAQKAGQEVQAYVDHYAAEFRKLKDALALSNDTFIRTTDPHHKAAAQEMWRRCDASGDIYKKAYEGLYCVGCERFLSEKDIENGVCVIHQKPPVPLKEENYFFRFSKYQEKLLAYLENKNVITPEWRREEAINFVKDGLEDFSISREKSRLSWGVPVPDDDTQVMYVWFDALTNYISTLGWPEDVEGNFKKFWEEGKVIQFAGKDQVRFQSLMWQAMLMSAGVKNTDSVFYHGFINSGGQKMSKSLGNVINPLDIVAEYGTDTLRYYLLRHVHPFEDTDVTLERIKEAYNGNLANGIGNLASRVMKMYTSYDVATRYAGIPFEVGDQLIEKETEFGAAIESYDFNRALNIIWEKIQKADQKIQETEPFKLIKTDEAKAIAIVGDLAAELFKIAILLKPVIPETATKIESAIRENRMPEALFPRKD